jgi:hypothetical protein
VPVNLWVLEIPQLTKIREELKKTISPVNLYVLSTMKDNRK